VKENVVALVLVPVALELPELEVKVALVNGFSLGCCCDVSPPFPPPPAPNENIVDVEAAVVVGLAMVVNANGFDDAAEELLADDVAVAVSLPRPSLLRRRIHRKLMQTVSKWLARGRSSNQSMPPPPPNINGK
jgi:hypothetical protein